MTVNSDLEVDAMEAKGYLDKTMKLSATVMTAEFTESRRQER